jgi:hypothetical protein
MRFLVLLIVFLLLAVVLCGVVGGLVLTGVLVAVTYWVSLRLNPRVRHRACGGTGRSHGWIYTWSYHRCQDCGGSGRMIRYGAARWGPQSIRDEAEARRRAIDDARQAGIWR